MKLSIFALTLGLICLSLTAWNNIVLGDSDQFREEFHFSYPLDAGKITVENQNGRIDIVGWDQNTVDISGTKYASRADVLKEIKVEVPQSAQSISIATIPPEPSWGNTKVRYIIHVPRCVELTRIVNANGAIHVEGTDGKADLRTSNGAVTVDGSKSGIEVSTRNGPVSLRHAMGPARLRTSNGSIDLDVDSVAELHASTTNGPITVTIPSNSGAMLRATTVRGPIRSDFGLTSENHGNELEGKIGSGGPLLDLSTTNGPIQVRSR